MNSQLRSRTAKPDQRYQKRQANKAARKRQLNKARKTYLTRMKNEQLDTA